MGRGISLRRWRMVRRQGGFSFPRAVAERLEGCLRSFRNRDACAELARLLALAHRRTGRTFVACREALAKVTALGLSEDQVRGALKVLERVGFLDRIGGGEFDREKQRRKPVIWRLGWAAKKSPTEDLRSGRDRFRGKDAGPVLRPLSRGFRACGLIPVAGDLVAVRQAARADLDRLRGQPVPGLSAAARGT